MLGAQTPDFLQGSCLHHESHTAGRGTAGPRGWAWYSWATWLVVVQLGHVAGRGTAGPRPSDCVNNTVILLLR